MGENIMDESFIQERVEYLDKIIKKRRSTRHFSEKEIPREYICKIIEAGVYAPSGSNSQNQRFIVIDEKVDIENIAKHRWVYPYRVTAGKDKNPYGILGNAKVLIFILSDNSLTDNRDNGEYYIWKKLEVQNCAASIQNMLLMATALGLANCWVSSSNEMNYSRLLSGKSWASILKNFDIPDYFEMQGCILLGFPLKLDKEGFPFGEKKHGVIWGSVGRRSLDHYLVKRRKDITNEIKVDVLRKTVIRIMNFMVSTTYKILVRLNRIIYKIEYKNFISGLK